MNIDFRPAGFSDINAVMDMVDAVKEHMESQGIFQWDQIYPDRGDFLQDTIDDSLYLGFVEDKLCSLYVISRESDSAYDDVTWDNDEDGSFIIHRFCVSPEFQNRGVGIATLKHIEESVQTMGYDSIRLDVFSENPHAIRLYEKSGYQKKGAANWRKGKFWLMEKSLKIFC